jgi:membrane protein DedA with SNARE-associated domain
MIPQALRGRTRAAFPGPDAFPVTRPWRGIRHRMIDRMEPFGRLVADLGELLGRSGPAAPAILFLASLGEYVFPPLPGDLLVILGAWYAVQGVISWPLAFAAVTAGAVAGAAVDYGIGRWLARRLDARAARRGLLSAERLARFVTAYQRWGSVLLVANRFMPGFRAFVFVGAGAAGIPLGKVLLLGGLSAALWSALLLFAGSLLVRSLPELVELFRAYSTLAWAVVLGAAVLLALGAWLRRGLRAAGRGER